jgi:hypothetical protein
VPFFCLNYFRISEVDGHIAIDYRQIHKEPPPDLTMLQRLLVPRKRGRLVEDIPERTVLAG